MNMHVDFWLATLATAGVAVTTEMPRDGEVATHYRARVGYRRLIMRVYAGRVMQTFGDDDRYDPLFSDDGRFVPREFDTPQDAVAWLNG